MAVLMGILGAFGVLGVAVISVALVIGALAFIF
jgi:hypothetical protein